MTNLILVRHGQSIWNKEKRFTGWMDFDLTEKYGKPEMEFSSSYDELNTFKEKIHKDVKININEFIRANSKVFTPSLVSSIEEHYRLEV